MNACEASGAVLRANLQVMGLGDQDVSRGVCSEAGATGREAIL